MTRGRALCVLKLEALLKQTRVMKYPGTLAFFSVLSRSNKYVFLQFCFNLHADFHGWWVLKKRKIRLVIFFSDKYTFTRKRFPQSGPAEPILGGQKQAQIFHANSPQWDLLPSLRDAFNFATLRSFKFSRRDLNTCRGCSREEEEEVIAPIQLSQCKFSAL